MFNALTQSPRSRDTTKGFVGAAATLTGPPATPPAWHPSSPRILGTPPPPVPQAHHNKAHCLQEGRGLGGVMTPPNAPTTRARLRPEGRQPGSGALG